MPTTGPDSIAQRAGAARENAAAYLAARRAQLGSDGSDGSDVIDSAQLGRKQWAHLHAGDIEALIEGDTEAATKVSVLLQALEQMHARITHDLHFDAGEATAPKDPATAHRLDALMQFLNETYHTTLNQIGGGR